MNASLFVSGNTLYVYGGVMELGEQEVTLDDLYSLDLAKLDKWNCIAEVDWLLSAFWGHAILEPQEW